MSDATTDRPLRIACVGDSITWGALIWRRKRDSYPARLQQLLGDGVVVGNFGSVGHTLQNDGDLPYAGSKPFRRSLEYDPGLVLIMLGTNDAKPDNWHGAEPFDRDYRLLVDVYRELPSSPRVVLMTPPCVFAKGGNGKVSWGVSPEAIGEMCGVVHGIARDEDLALVDVHAATEGHGAAFRFDGIHPGPVGAALIARTAFDVLEAAPAAVAAG